MGSIESEYLSRDFSTAIKGIFVITVFNGHLCQYVELHQTLIELPYILIEDWIGQCIVACFLFCSGYGIFHSIRQGGYLYIKQLPRKRIFKVWLHFVLAIVLFILMNLCLGNTYTVLQYVEALFVWFSIGNSTWYIFATISLYFISYLSGQIVFSRIKNEKLRDVLLVVFVGIGTLIYVFIMSHLKDDSVWYNTVTCFPVGMLYALLQEKIDRWNTKFWHWLVSVVLLSVAYLSLILWGNYYLRAPVFAILVFVVSMRISINNPILQWIGKHTFSIYILQRIPMIILTYLGINQYEYLMAFGCLAITLLMAWGFDLITNRIDKRLRI